MKKAIKCAIQKLKRSIGDNPMEESILNLYIHNACAETIKELYLDIPTKGMTNKYLQFFDEVKDVFLTE